eukprot:TRINITY_DN5017_c0_g1_i1.p1 TRINITY_DN5017_c0_g1~~TRINITY_DN5017_c0_g1_i1.p1  ORF type:complete len:420 (-),score=61.96 TRINITY_DN5017_c0_g1_i1:268-1431(-)
MQAVREGLRILRARQPELGNYVAAGFELGDGWRGRAFALLCGAHPRLGSQSVLHVVAFDVLRTIAGYLQPGPSAILVSAPGTGVELHAFYAQRGRRVQRLEFSAAAAIAVCGTRAALAFGRDVRIWDLCACRSQMTAAHTVDVTALALCGDTLATAGKDGTVRVWCTFAGRCVASFATPAVPPRFVALTWAPGASAAEAIAFDAGTAGVRLCLLGSPGEYACSCINFHGAERAAAFQRTLAFAGGRSVCVARAAPGGECKCPLARARHSCAVCCVDIDSRCVAVGDAAGEVSLYVHNLRRWEDPEAEDPTLTLAMSVRAHCGLLAGCCLADDAVVTCGEVDGLAKVFDRSEGAVAQQRRTVVVHSGCIVMCVVHSDLRFTNAKQILK